jgi:non-specific serine/threonine protein kinase
MNSTDNELIVIIRPEGRFCLERRPAGEEIVRARAAFEARLFDLYSKDHGEALLLLGFSGRHGGFSVSPSLCFLLSAAAPLGERLIKNPDLETLREKTPARYESGEPAAIIEAAPYLDGSEHLGESWFESFARSFEAAFLRLMSAHRGRADGFFAAYNPRIHPAGRVFFHMVENKKNEKPFAFMATYSKHAEGGRTKHLPLKNAISEFGGDKKKLFELISAVTRAAEKSRLIGGLLETGELFHPIALSAEEAHAFLKEVPLYEESGVLCRIPDWWKEARRPPAIRIKVGDDAPSRVGFNALLDFRPEISLGGLSVSPDELRRLARESDGLILLKGKWVEADANRLKQALAAFERAAGAAAGEGGITLFEALRLNLTADKFAAVAGGEGSGENSVTVEISNGEWLAATIKKLTRPETVENIDCGKDFQGALRPYQQKGLNWLNLMKNLGLGACLADDMGLGKTVQVLALLNSAARAKNLLVVPASLIGNWANEIARFTPSLKYLVLHPSAKAEKGAGIDDIEKAAAANDLIITTYAMLHRYEKLRDIYWDALIIDEAQNIKNPDTKQTKAAKRLKAAFRVALTGTPVENRLSDLWSIFDFINRGLLGTLHEFTEFARRLSDRGEGYSRLKKTASPFILRRLKTDRSIISDLPDKIEMKTYSALSKKQAAVYDSLVKEIKEALENAEEGIARRGLILSSLMKFKQICNHPDQYLGQKCYAESESGKFARLREICETIREKRERLLVFTQFREITGPLSDFLSEVFGRGGLVLHGGTPVARRADIVARFQGDDYIPFMVLSLKAGGTGLNLTAASHVVHFDRWWNPAVENQATDRAFRIGQSKNVVVHKFITKGTLEEKIDLMIEDKIKLSKEVIPDISESFITEMSDEQLMKLFDLSPDRAEFD